MSYLNHGHVDWSNYGKQTLNDWLKTGILMEHCYSIITV